VLKPAWLVPLLALAQRGEQQVLGAAAAARRRGGRGGRDKLVGALAIVRGGGLPREASAARRARPSTVQTFSRYCRPGPARPRVDGPPSSCREFCLTTSASGPVTFALPALPTSSRMACKFVRSWGVRLPGCRGRRACAARTADTSGSPCGPRPDAAAGRADREVRFLGDRLHQDRVCAQRICMSVA